MSETAQAIQPASRKLEEIKTPTLRGQKRKFWKNYVLPKVAFFVRGFTVMG